MPQGTLHFTATYSDDELKKGLQDTQQRLKDSSKETARAVQQAQTESAKATRQSLEEQKRIIREMETEYGKLQKTISKTTPGGGQQTLINEANKLAQAIAEEQNALNALNQEVALSEQRHTSLRTQIRQLSEEMATLIANGINEQSAEYKALADELGRLKDIQGDIQAQGSVLANDEAKFQAVLSGLQGVAGGFGAVTGAMALFGAENEELQRGMQRLMATMQIVQGVQAVAQALNKDSYFQLIILRKVRELYNASLAKGTVAKGLDATATTAQTSATTLDATATNVATGAKVRLIAVLRTLWATMLSNPFTAILAGLGAVALAIYKMTEKGREATRQNEELKAKIIDLASEPVGAVLRLSQEFESLGDNLVAQEAFVKRNQSAFESLGLSINNVADASRILIKEKDKLVQAFVDIAKGKALLEGSEEGVKGLLKIDQEIERLEKEAKEYDRAVEDYARRGNSYGSVTMSERAKGLRLEIAELKRDRDALNKDISTKVSKSLEYSAKGQKTKEQIGGSPFEADKQKQLQQEQDYYDSKLSIHDRYLKQKNELDQRHRRGELNHRDYKAQSDSLESQYRIDADKEKIRKQEEAQRKGQELAKKAESERKRQQEEERRFAEELQKKYQDAVEAHNEYLRSKLSLDERYAQQDKALEERLATAKTDRERSNIATERATLRQQYETERIKAQDSETKRRQDELKALQEKYRSYEERITDIKAEYSHKRKLLEEAGASQASLQALDQESSKRQGEEALKALQSSEVYEKLFGDLSKLSTEALEEIIEAFDNKSIHLGVQLNPQDLETIKSKVGEAKRIVEDANPFKALIKGIKEYKEASDKAGRSEALSKIARSAQKSFQSVNQYVGVAKQALEAFGVDMDSKLGDTINGLMKANEAGGKIAEGIASKNPIAVAQGVVGLVQAGIELFGRSDKDAERAIKRHAREVKHLEDSYKDLEYQVSRALGASQYSHGREQINNLKQQQAHYQAMAREEASKKKKDDEKIAGYHSKVRELQRAEEELVRKMQEELLTTNARDAARELGDAFVTAFAKGENAVEAFRLKVDKLIANMMKQLIIKKLFEEPVGNIFNKYTQRWVQKDGSFAGFEAIERDSDALSRELKSVADGVGSVGKRLLEKFALSENSTLSGGSISADVKGVREETAKALEGQINAIRLSGEDAGAVRHEMQEQLRSISATLTSIKGDTAYLRHLEGIATKVQAIELSMHRSSSERSPQSGGVREASVPSLDATAQALRSQGL